MEPVTCSTSPVQLQNKEIMEVGLFVVIAKSVIFYNKVLIILSFEIKSFYSFSLFISSSENKSSLFQTTDTEPGCK